MQQVSVNSQQFGISQNVLSGTAHDTAYGDKATIVAMKVLAFGALAFTDFCTSRLYEIVCGGETSSSFICAPLYLLKTAARMSTLMSIPAFIFFPR
jgi:hypothetical protein